MYQSFPTDADIGKQAQTCRWQGRPLYVQVDPKTQWETELEVYTTTICQTPPVSHNSPDLLQKTVAWDNSLWNNGLYTSGR